MRKECMDAQSISKSVVEIYLKLAELVKENKKNSEEYNELLALLSKAKEIEKRKYSLFDSRRVEREETFSIIAETPKDNSYFLLQTKEALSAIRSLNLMDSSKVYALDGIIPYNRNVQRIQEYLNESFYYEISRYLNNGNMEEKDTFIDFQFAILASSPMIEEECLTFPKTNNALTREETYASLKYLMPKVQFLTNHLLDVYDDMLDSKTILLMLYTKACISLLPAMYQHMALNEFKNSIDLNRILGFMKGHDNQKTCDILSYICEEKIVDLSK